MATQSVIRSHAVRKLLRNSLKLGSDKVTSVYGGAKKFRKKFCYCYFRTRWCHCRREGPLSETHMQRVMSGMYCTKIGQPAIRPPSLPACSCAPPDMTMPLTRARWNRASGQDNHARSPDDLHSARRRREGDSHTQSSGGHPVVS